MVQRLVVGDLVPRRMVAPSRGMSTDWGWKVAVQPWSQREEGTRGESGKDMGDAGCRREKG
jgi:hypothetical protein